MPDTHLGNSILLATHPTTFIVPSRYRYLKESGKGMKVGRSRTMTAQLVAEEGVVGRCANL